MATTGRVLAISELLETILLAPASLKIRDLMHCRQVCTAWRDSIDRSFRMRQRMHLAPIPPSDEPPVLCDTLPKCIRRVDGPRKCAQGESYTFSMIFRARAMTNLDLTRLNSILLVQPKYNFNYVGVKRNNGHLDETLWYYDALVVSDSVVTIGAVVNMVQAALAKHESNCMHHELSMSVHSIVTLVALVVADENVNFPKATGFLDEAWKQLWEPLTHRCDEFWAMPG